LRQIEWVVYAKRPFAGPAAVLAYLSRYTHRVAIANSRLIALEEKGVTFNWKDYRNKGRYRQKTVTLATDEFIRRFLIHVLPSDFSTASATMDSSPTPHERTTWQASVNFWSAKPPKNCTFGRRTTIAQKTLAT